MEIYLVGGFVRDTLMGRQAKDVDYVVTGSTPEQMIDLGYKQVGADFPVFLDDEGTEYALARKERKTSGGYHGFECDFSPDVTIEEDLARRDLTINAMAMLPESGNQEIIDPYGGLQDIENKVLRHVSSAFAEDPVRVLRVARFMARYGPEWSVDASTIELMVEMVKSGELNNLTRERVLKELEKALMEPYPHLFFKTLDQCGALEVVMPELVNGTTCFGERVHETSPKLKFARLMFVSGDEGETFMERMNVSLAWRNYAKMYKALHAPIHGYVDILHSAGAYQNKELFLEIMQHLNVSDDDPLLSTFLNTKDIGFADLTPEQQATLRGPEIGAAILQKRKEVCGE